MNRDGIVDVFYGQLNVQHIVEGSVRKAGNRVRITAQLTSLADGYQLWAERYTAISTTSSPSKTTSRAPSSNDCA